MNKRIRTIEIILYLDNTSHLELLSELIKKYKYAYILHDKDTNDDGTLKKAHYHLLIFFDNARWTDAILKEINIDNKNLIEFKDNKVYAIRYLIHSNNKDKFQYDIDNIITNVDILPYFNNIQDKETDSIFLILDYINSFNGIIRYKDLYDYVLSNNVWSVYRRNYSIIKDILLEHNAIKY